MESMLKTKYTTDVIPTMKKEFGYTNVMQVPKVKKVTINVGYGRHTKDAAFIERVEKTLTVISGQKPVHNKAKKSISNFKIREGMPIGTSVTLRGPGMYEFLYKLINIVFPRVRDFRGLSPKGLDRQGNCTIGFKEHISFPEVTSYTMDGIHGLQIVINTSAKSKAEGLSLLKHMGFPFKEN